MKCLLYNGLFTQRYKKKKDFKIEEQEMIRNLNFEENAVG